MESLLLKFDELIVDNLDRISEIDKEYCIGSNHSYSEALKRLQLMLAELKKIESDFPDRFKINEERDELILENKYSNPEKWFEFEQSSPTNFILKVNQNIRSLQSNFINRILYYFRSTYSISLPNDQIKKSFENDFTVTWEKIVDQIFDNTDGLDLEEKAIVEFKASFKRGLRWTNRIEQKKNKVLFPDQFYYGDNYRGGIRFDYREDVDHFTKALSFYEFEMLEYVGVFKHAFPDGDIDVLDFKEIYETPQSGRLKSMKLFKNGKVDLTFKKEEYATEFMKLYALGSFD